MIEHTEDPRRIKELIEKSPAVIVDFSTSWCMPCEMLAAELTQVDKKFGAKLVIIKVDKDVVKGRKTEPDAPKVDPIEFETVLPFFKEVDALGGIPVLVFFKDGQRLDKILDNPPVKTGGIVFGFIPGLDSAKKALEKELKKPWAKKAMESILRESKMVSSSS
nr:thioredoxin domain-containing protein [Candidatus Sigynarchaeota archaeon]